MGCFLRLDVVARMRRPALASLFFFSARRLPALSSHVCPSLPLSPSPLKAAVFAQKKINLRIFRSAVLLTSK